MKIDLAHKNLNTFYVNLSALLKYLQHWDFVGTVKFEAKAYEAEIIFSPGKKIEARENDHISGRIAVGADVLPRVLIRAHEPGGLINIYEETELKARVEEVPETAPEIEDLPVEVVEEQKSEQLSLKERLGLPSLPFSFGKKKSKEKGGEIFAVDIAEEKKEIDHLEDWHELLALLGEILQTVETTLADANLNFIWVFDKVRGEVFEDYPFLHPNSTIFEYGNGRITMTEQINNNLFIASIAESLERLMEKFHAHPRFDEVRKSVVLSLLELMNKNHAQYDRFFITQQLERVIDI